MNEGELFGKKAYSVFLAISGALAVYSSGIPGINLTELLLIIALLYSLYVLQLRIHINIVGVFLNAFLLYAFFVTLVAFMAGAYEIDWLHRFLRFILYTECAVVIPEVLFDENVFYKSMVIFAEITVLALLFQYAMYYTTGSYFRLNNLFGAAVSTNGIDYDLIFSQTVFRPSAFFSEPSHCAQNLFIPLSYLLYGNHDDERKHAAIEAAFIILGILLTKSLWGILLVSIMVILFFLKSKDLKKTGSILLLVIVMFVILRETNVISDALTRIDFSNLNGSAAYTGRFGALNYLSSLPSLQLVFGGGFGNVGTLSYSNSIFYLISSVGIIGTALLLISLTKGFTEKNISVQIILICFTLLSFGSSIMISPMFTVVMTIVIFESLKRNNLRKDLDD